MRMVYINFNVGILPDVKKQIAEMKIEDYQIFDRVLSKNKKGDPKFDTPVWPGYNTAVFIPMTDSEKLKELFQWIQSFNQSVTNDDELISACSWEMDHYIYN